MTLEQLSLPTLTTEEIRTHIGQGPRHLIAESLPKEARLSDDGLVDKALEIYNEMYSKTYMNTTSLYDGMDEAILMLSKYYKIAVLSNKQDEYVKNLVSQLLPKGICEIARGTVGGIPAKPDPKVALEVVEALGVSHYECMLIGDSDIDLLTARNAEMDCLSVSWGYVSKAKLIMTGAEEIITSPSELIDFFK